MFNKLLDPEGSRLPRLAQLGPEIGVEVQRLWALTLPQLATEIMTKAFTPDYVPGTGVVGLRSIADYFLPDYGPERLGDVMSQEEHALHDLIAEGAQLLEQARLVRPAFGSSGNSWHTTRLGRMALESGSVPSLVERIAG